MITNWLAVQIPLQLASAIDALNKGVKGASQAAIFHIAWMGAAVILVRTLSRVLFFTPGRLIEYQIKNNLFSHLLALQPSFYARWQSGDIVSRISNDMTFVRVMAGFGMLQIVNVSTALVLTGYAMINLSLKLTLFILAPVIIAMISVNIAIQKLFNLTKRNQEELSTLSEHILSTLQGVQTIQGFRAEDAFLNSFLEKNRQYMDTNLKLTKIRSWFLPLLGLAGAFCIWLLFVLSGPMIQAKTLTVGQLIAFLSYVAYLIMPLRSLGWLLSVFQRGQTSLERIFALLEEPIERPDLPEPIQPGWEKSPKIEFKHLHFAYPDELDREVLQDINFQVHAGEMIGIFGKTGAGKSTILRILARLYNPPEGQVFVEDTDIRKLDLDAWRKELAYAPQSPFLFSETIEENIAMGEIEPERVERAIQQAALKKDLAALPQGLQTLVGERGIMLSGGQRQRSALARAFYRPFRLLLLDDVLSAVDHATEQALIQSLQETAHNAQGGQRPTIFLVSHRISALASADRILVLEKGKIIAQGTHQELTQQEGLYRETWLEYTNSEHDAPSTDEQAPQMA